MNFKKLVLLFLVLVAGIANSQAQEKKFKVHTIAFYNVENLFDTINQANYDEEYLPQSGWTSKKYKHKLNNWNKRSTKRITYYNRGV
jgi:Skp family chaperone for outer membrane proteins